MTDPGAFYSEPYLPEVCRKCGKPAELRILLLTTEVEKGGYFCGRCGRKIIRFGNAWLAKREREEQK